MSLYRKEEEKRGGRAATEIFKTKNSDGRAHGSANTIMSNRWICEQHVFPLKCTALLILCNLLSTLNENESALSGEEKHSKISFLQGKEQKITCQWLFSSLSLLLFSCHVMLPCCLWQNVPVGEQTSHKSFLPISIFKNLILLSSMDSFLFLSFVFFTLHSTPNCPPWEPSGGDQTNHWSLPQRPVL